jgi:hypothetical protein
MKTIMKLLTMAVLLMAVVGICGCTSAPQTNLSNTTANATKNTTKAAVKSTKATVKPNTVKPTTPVATPVPAVATATPYPAIKNLHGAGETDAGGYATATPYPTAKPTQAPTLTWSTLPPQSGVMKGGYALVMAYYNDHPSSGLGAFYTPKWYVDGKLVYTGSPVQAYVSWGIDTTNLSVGTHTVTLEAAGTGLSVTATFTVIPAAK